MDEDVNFTDEEKAILSNEEIQDDNTPSDIENDIENTIPIQNDDADVKQDNLADKSEEPEKPNDKGEDKQKFVPLGALHEEREERKKAQREAAEQREVIARMKERFKAILQTDNPQQEQAPQTPDPETDFVGYIKWLGQAVEQQQAQQRQQAEQQAAVEYETQRQQLLHNAWMEGVNEASKDAPDVNDAADFIYSLRERQLIEAATLYPEMNNPAARQQQMRNELSELIDRAIRTGQNPAVVLYNLAKSNGYQEKTQEPNDAFDKINEAQNRSKTLAASSGQSLAGEMTLEKLASLTDAEFSAWKKENPRKFERIMGGQ
ncbi:hypothetical protein [Bartonella tamiae]|uniref:hypothetical protein n=1 Tax=Bartonella tamiae TaxID=373638 RepID=UPI00026E77AC|nr:hypothetical protein [Bartonella tamiae]EJF92651.1 hypothetical protein MEG_01821 [Bartonella tamiae Th307]